MTEDMALENQSAEEETEAVTAEEVSDGEDNPTLPEAEKDYIDPVRTNNRAHLTSSVPRAARGPHNAMTKQELNQARELFGGMDDAEIQRLYRRVTE